MWRISLALLVVFVATPHANAECNVCDENSGAACTSNTTFQLCFNGVPQGQVFSCPNPAHVCTTFSLICADPTSNTAIQAACGNTAQCGLCQGVGDGSYACTSQNTFGMCLANNLTTVIGTCPDDQICLTSRANLGRNPCVNECLRDANDMCDIGGSTTATPTTATTPTTPTTATSPTSPTTGTTNTTSPTGATSGSEDSVCASRTQVGRYPYPNDTACTTYVYCYLNSTTNRLAGRAMSCPRGRYFNPSINSCQAALPAGCVTTV